MPIETPFFFAGCRGKLFGVLHDASGQSDRTPFVFCHPFGEEKLWTHRVFVTFARELAKAGHAVLRFDYAGNGDSDQDFHESSIETALADIASAIDEVKGRLQSRRVNLLGLRLGATLAWQAAATRTDVDTLIMWAPIVDGDRYLQELLRANLTTQLAVYREVREDREALLARLAAGETVNIDGYEVSRDMADQLARLKLAPAQSAHTRCLIAQVERSAAAPVAAALAAFCQHVAGSEVCVTQEEPFWKEIQRFYDSAPNLSTITRQWMERHRCSAAVR